MKREKINYYRCDKDITFNGYQREVRHEDTNYNYPPRDRKKERKNNYYGR